MALGVFCFTTVSLAQMPTAPNTGESQTGSKSPGNASTNPSIGTNGDTKVKSSDRRFLDRVVKLNAEEVDVSRIVSQNATDPQVRKFAMEMVNAHEKVASELTALASSKGVALPNERDNTKKWTEKKSRDVDENYVKLMNRAHKTMLGLFEKAAKSDDSEIAAFANKYLPDIHEYYYKSETLKSQIES